MKKRLEAHVYSREVVFFKELPKTKTGKILKRKLRRMHEQEAKAGNSVMKSSPLGCTGFFLPICYSTNAAALTDSAYHWHNHQAVQDPPAVTAL